MRAVVATVALVSASAPARADSLTLSPFLGVVSESDVVNGAVRFSDGGVDFISIEPELGLMIGVELGLQLRPKLVGMLALSYASADATYFEDDTQRPDIGVSTSASSPASSFAPSNRESWRSASAVD